MAPAALQVLHARIERCRACPRLVAWREEIGRTKRRAYAACSYWSKPIRGFGDPHARIVVIGLAPGAHGANRTGRVFTGDRSGDFLYAALHRAKLASQPHSVAADDGMRLRDVFITLPVRCAPPDNRPSPSEIARCSGFFDEELALLKRAKVLVALGAIAWDSCLARAARGGLELRPRPRFAHLAEARLGDVAMLGSYHVSQQNTQTGRLTPAMFDAILSRASELAAR